MLCLSAFIVCLVVLLCQQDTFFLYDFLPMNHVFNFKCHQCSMSFRQKDMCQTARCLKSCWFTWYVEFMFVIKESQQKVINMLFTLICIVLFVGKNIVLQAPCGNHCSDIAKLSKENEQIRKMGLRLKKNYVQAAQNIRDKEVGITITWYIMVFMLDVTTFNFRRLEIVSWQWI